MVHLWVSMQEIRPFTKVRDSFKKILVTRDMLPTFHDENGILTMNAKCESNESNVLIHLIFCL